MPIMDTYTLNLVGLLSLCTALFAVKSREKGEASPTTTKDPKQAAPSQWPFFTVYALVMGSDWLQARIPVQALPKNPADTPTRARSSTRSTMTSTAYHRHSSPRSSPRASSPARRPGTAWAHWPTATADGPRACSFAARRRSRVR